MAATTTSHVTATPDCVRVVPQALPLRFRPVCRRTWGFSTAGHPAARGKPARPMWQGGDAGILSIRHWHEHMRNHAQILNLLARGCLSMAKCEYSSATVLPADAQTRYSKRFPAAYGPPSLKCRTTASYVQQEVSGYTHRPPLQPRTADSPYVRRRRSSHYLVESFQRANMCGVNARTMDASGAPLPWIGDANWLRRQQYARMHILAAFPLHLRPISRKSRTSASPLKYEVPGAGHQPSPRCRIAVHRWIPHKKRRTDLVDRSHVRTDAQYTPTEGVRTQTVPTPRYSCYRITLARAVNRTSLQNGDT